jgi:hypothetical protein
VGAVEMVSSTDPGRQLTARCVAQPFASPRVVADDITRAWMEDLRYRYWEAHSLRMLPTSVELDVVTQIGDGEYYNTGLIVVAWSPGEGPRH